jgi:CheY-like chemotaxis protein
VHHEQAVSQQRRAHRLLRRPHRLTASRLSGAISAPKRMKTMAKLRVLIVDDCHDTADTLALLVNLWGHVAHAAYDGPSALDLAAAFRPHVVLLDLGLPGMDGPSVLRHLRRQPNLGTVRVIAVTGYGDHDHRHQVEHAGLDGYLLKPVDPTTLEHLLNSLSGPDVREASGEGHHENRRDRPCTIP